MRSILQQTIFLCEQSRKMNDSDLKMLLVSMATKIDGLEKSRVNQSNSSSYSTPNGNQNSNVFEKIQSKLIQIEERRKAWDETMAIIFSEKQKSDLQYKKRLEKIQSFEKKVGSRLDQVEQKVKKELQGFKAVISEKMSNWEDDRNSFRVIIMDKVEKARKQLFKQLQKKIEQMKQSLQHDLLIKQSKFYVKCNQLLGLDQNSEQELTQSKIDSNDIINQKQDNLMLNQAEKIDNSKNKKCANVQLIVQNFAAYAHVKEQLNENQITMERFQTKLINMGSRIEVLENKIGDVVSSTLKTIVRQEKMQERKQQHSNSKQAFSKNQSYFQKNLQPQQPQQHQQQQQSKFKQQFLLTYAKNYQNFLVQDRTVTYVNSGNINESIVLFGFPQIRAKNYFSIKIQHTLNNFISIGIADEKYSGSRDIWNQEYFFMMRGKGDVYCGPSNKVREAVGQFRTGDVIRVEVNLKEQKIIWYINQVLRAICTDRRITNQVSWVPFVRFFNVFDSIKWLS